MIDHATLDPLLARDEPLEETDVTVQDLLDDLQGNILTSPRAQHTHYYVLSFDVGTPNVPQLLKQLATGTWPGAPAGSGPDSELEVRAKRLLARSKWAAPALSANPTPYSGNLMLTRACFDAYYPQATLPPDPAFQAGMAARRSYVNDPAALDPPGLNGRTIHALFTVTFDGQPAPALAALDQLLAPWLVVKEVGYTLRHAGRAIEPFGYRDGVSQPLFYRADLRANESIEGRAVMPPAYGRWRSHAPLRSVLVPDPNGKSKHACGSYAVFRKLKQDVHGFYAQAERLAGELAALPGSPVPALTRDDIADHLIGRRLGGEPLERCDNLNDFAYGSPSACPAHAHVRRVNPRDQGYARARLVRRATVFGPELARRPDGRPTLNAPPAAPVGLLFMCFQADIAGQYETLQGWANDTTRGADPVIGQPPAGVPNRIGFAGSGLVLPYGCVVEPMWGAYFFAPSLSFFQ